MAGTSQGGEPLSVHITVARRHRAHRAQEGLGCEGSGRVACTRFDLGGHSLHSLKTAFFHAPHTSLLRVHAGCVGKLLDADVWVQGMTQVA